MDAKKLDIAILLFPGVTAQDFIGPHTILSLFGNIRLCWKDKNPVATDSGIRILPDTTFAECEGAYDMLLVPGGPPDDEGSLLNGCCKPDNIKSSEPCSGEEALNTQIETGFPRSK